MLNKKCKHKFGAHLQSRNMLLLIKCIEINGCLVSARELYMVLLGFMILEFCRAPPSLASHARKAIRSHSIEDDNLTAR